MSYSRACISIYPIIRLFLHTPFFIYLKAYNISQSYGMHYTLYCNIAISPKVIQALVK
jgi:hypothetical protein